MDHVLVIRINESVNVDVTFKTVFDRRIRVPTSVYQLGWNSKYSRLVVLYSKKRYYLRTYYLKIYSPLRTTHPQNDQTSAWEVGCFSSKIGALNRVHLFWIKGTLDPKGSSFVLFTLERAHRKIVGQFFYVE